MTATRGGLACIAAVALLSPFFFVLHRLTVFHTVPYDDYAPYLLWLAGTGQGAVPDSPYCYRLLSMVAALPFFALLPPLGLTNTPADLPPLWLRATTAINLLNYLSLVGAALLTARTAVRRCAMTPAQGVLAGGLLFALAWFTQITAIDGLALLLITAGIALVDRPVGFAALVLLSAGANEKVALVLTLWLGARVVLVVEDRVRLARPFLMSAAAIALYFAAVAVLHLPGNEYQTQPGGFAATLRQNLLAYVSGRGVVLNLLPIVVLTALAVWGHWRQPVRPGAVFRATDLLTIAGLAGVALLFTQFFQAGRIVMHAAPLFVIPAVAALRNR